jgi:hypothetical protein
VKKVHKLVEYIDDTMQEYEDKVARGGDLSSKDVECLKDLAKTKMAILTNEAMESEGGYSERYSRDGDMNGRTSHGRMFYGGGSYPRYYSYAKRDSMGRYSRDGYSYADAKMDMIAELKDLAKKAPDEKTRQELEHFANEMESK